jgi:ABC-type transporter Mla subunit MlaD
MADIPSLILKGLGVVLILVGLTGTVSGFYALKVVHDYDPGELGTAAGSIVEIRDTLNKNRDEITTNLESGAGKFSDASAAVTEAGAKVESAALTLGSVASSMTQASADMKSASAANKEAGNLLEDAASGLRDWADAYSFNGSSLPQKSAFQDAVDKISDASGKLKETGDKLSSSSANLENSAKSLNGTKTKLEEASVELKDTGADLQGASENFGALKKPYQSVIGEMISPLQDTTESLQSGLGGDTKTYAYLVVGYFILIHLILLGLGASLVIIEINLFYPIA